MNVNKDLILVFDLDGTCADFNTAFYANNEKFEEKGFFASLEPYPSLEKIGQLPNKKYVLSALPISMKDYGVEEKIAWTQKHMPFIPKENIIICYTGENKAEVFKKILGADNLKNVVLFDDYKKNLLAWKEEGGFVVKKRSSEKGIKDYDAVLTDFALINFCLSEIQRKANE